MEHHYEHFRAQDMVLGAVCHPYDMCSWLQAYCDDNTTYSEPPCVQDGDIPPYGNLNPFTPSPAVGLDNQKKLNISYW